MAHMENTYDGCDDDDDFKASLPEIQRWNAARSELQEEIAYELYYAFELRLHHGNPQIVRTRGEFSRWWAKASEGVRDLAVQGWKRIPFSHFRYPGVWQTHLWKGQS